MNFSGSIYYEVVLNMISVNNIFYAHLKLIIPEQYKYADIAIRQDKNSTWISLSADSHKMWKSDNRSVAS